MTDEDSWIEYGRWREREAIIAELEERIGFDYGKQGTEKTIWLEGLNNAYASVVSWVKARGAKPSGVPSSSVPPGVPFEGRYELEWGKPKKPLPRIEAHFMPTWEFLVDRVNLLVDAVNELRGKS